MGTAAIRSVWDDGGISKRTISIYGQYTEVDLGADVIQVVKLWSGNFTNVAQTTVPWYGYAVLNRDGEVKIKEFYGEENRDVPQMEKTYHPVKAAEDWTDIVQIAGYGGELYSLHRDGTVCSVSLVDQLDEYHDIKKLHIRVAYQPYTSIAGYRSERGI